jgi:solute carrier family 25 (mitochondrial aspartate/glutamate transporter), member 12/13
MQTVLANPITVIKTRLEVVGFSEYSGVVDACKKIYAQEGLPAFFTGIKVSLVRDVPFSGVFYPIYSFFRGELTKLYAYEMKCAS